MPRLLVVFCLATSIAQGQVRLTVGENATLLLDGKPCRAIGVNYYSCFLRHLNDPANTTYEAGFTKLAAHGVPFVRFSASGFMPSDMKLYLDNKDEYLKRLDDVVHCAEQHGIGLIPSLFWQNACIPDLAGEPRNAWGNPESKTTALMRQYTKDVVSRYVESPAIWAYEFGNEYDLAVDLPNAKDQRPGVNVAFGTMPSRSEADDLRFEMVVTAFREFAKVVHEIDPGRLVTTGNSLPRQCSAHLRADLRWQVDSREEFMEQLAAFNPDPCTLISVHIYPFDHEKRFGKANTSYDEIIAACMETSRKAGKPLFIGEWGGPDDKEGEPRDAARRDNFEMITAIDRNNVPLSAVWVYDLSMQESFANITSTNTRKYLLKAVELANHRIAACADGSHRVDLSGGNFSGALLDFTANTGRSGNGFNPLQHASYCGENLFRDDGTGLYFEHIFNGTAKDAEISMFSPNHDAHAVVQVDASTGVLRHTASASSWGIESELRYTLNGNAVDMAFTATPTRDQFPLGYAAFMWASYMNHTRDRRIHFYGVDGEKEGWTTFGDDTTATPEAFETGTISFKGVADLPCEDGAKTLNVIENPSKKFLLPFYYGLVDGDGDLATSDDTMAYIMMFDQKAPMRFALWNFIVNAEGKPDTHSPAWDWQFVIQKPRVGTAYNYRARMLYVPFTNEYDIKAVYERWIASIAGK